MAEEYVKRINLSFDLRNEDAKRCYEKIIFQPGNTKTLFVINAINGSKTNVDREEIKECLREVLEQYNFTVISKEQEVKQTNEIPSEIMDLLSNI
jgi:Icc-related predicted phosphoesterase